MIPDSIIVAACTIPESLNSKKTARGTVEKRVDPETIIIKVGQDKIEAKVPEGKLQAGDAVIVKVRKDYVLLEKMQAQSEQTSRQSDTFSSASPHYSSKQISSVLNSAIEQLKADPNNHHLPQRIISVINAMKSGISDDQREALRKVVAAAADPGNSPAELQSRRQELINLLESIEKEIVKNPPVKGSEKLIILEIPDRNIPEGLYKFSGKEDLQVFLQSKGIQIPDPGNTHTGSTESRNDLYLRTFPSDSGTTAILLDKKGLMGELESWTRGFSSSVMQSIPVRVFEQILSSTGKIDISALNQIDAILQSAQYTLPQSRAGSEAAQTASVAQWLQTALENSSILTEITMRPPVSASTVAIQLEEINRSLSADSIHHLTAPEQIAVTDKILENTDKRADFLIKLMQKIGYNFENKIASSENVEIESEPDLKSSLLSFIGSIKETTPVKNGPQVDEVKETLGKIESLRKSIEARIQAPEMETPEAQTEKNANIVAKAVSLAQWIHSAPQSTQTATVYKGKSGRDNNFVSTLSFLLKEISTSVDKKVLPEFTDPVLAEKAAEFVDTKSKTDFFTKLLRMFTIDPERENSESNPAQKSVFHDLSKTILSLFGAETGTDSLEGNFIQKSTDRTFFENSRFIPEQGGPEKISPEKKIPPEDIKELLTKVESLRRSIEAQQQAVKTGNSEAQVDARAQVIAKAVSIANWFSSAEDKISAALNAILKEISSQDSKSFSFITNPQYVKDIAESPDVKSRADLWAKLSGTSVVSENRTDTTSALTQKHSPSDLVNTIISFLTAGEKIKPSDDISNFATDKAYSSTPSQNRPEQVRAENVPPSGKNNLSPEEIREFQARIESLKKTIESHLGAASIGADEEKWKEKTLIVEKTISLARWLNSSSETDQTEAVKAEKGNTVTAINALLKEIITAIDKKSLPEFTNPAFVRDAVKSVESTGRNGLLEQILRISGTEIAHGETHLKSVFRQAFIELTSSIASFLAEESSSSSGTIQEVSSRDAGGKPLTYTSDIKPEYVNAEKTVPSQGSRIPPEDIKELLKEFESLRKSLQTQLQSNGTKFTGNQTVSNGEIEQKATVLARWFSSGSEISYSVRESSSGSENTVTKLTTLLNAIHTALDKRVLPEFTDPEYVKSATESPDVKGRADLWTKLFSISGVSESHSDITSSPSRKYTPSDLADTVISLLTAGGRIKPSDDIHFISELASAEKSCSDIPSKGQPEQIQTEKTPPPEKSNLSPEEIKEFQARVESLKKAVEAHLSAPDARPDKEILKDKALIVEKAISLARWLNSYSEADLPEALRAEKAPNTVSSLNTLLKEIITAIDRKSLPEFTNPAFAKAAAESAESSGRSGLLEQILRISGADTTQAEAQTKPVFRQAFNELTNTIASFLVEKNSSSSEVTQEISSRDTGGKPLTYTSVVKTEHVNAEKAIPPQENRIPPEDLKELLQRIESLRKSLQARLQLSGAEFTNNQSVSKGEIEERAAALVRWFSSGAEVSQSGQEITSGNEKNTSILNSLLKAIHTALDKRSLPEFTNPEFVKSTAESPNVKSRTDLLSKLLEKSGIRPDYPEISRDIPEKTAPVVAQTGNHSPKQTAEAGTRSRFRTENIEELKVQLESLKKELMSQLQTVETETGRKQIKEGLVNLAKALSEIPARLEKLIGEKLISSEKSDISDSISRSLIKEFLSDKAVTDAFLLKFHPIPISDDSTLFDKIKVLTEMIADPSSGKGEQLIQTLKEFISGKLPAQLSLLSGLLNGIASVSPEKEQNGSQLFSFIRNETAEIIKNFIPETFDWFSGKLTEAKLPETGNQGTAQKSDAPQVLKPEYLPSFPALRADLVNTATEILNILHGFEKALNTQLSGLIPAAKDSAGQAESMSLTVLSGNRQLEAAKQMINLPEVIGTRVTRALREIEELAGRIITEGKTEEEVLANAAPERSGVETRQSVRETVNESITRREFLNRTEQVISKAVSDLKDTLARVNTGSHESLSGGTSHSRLQGYTVQTSVILEKAVEEVIKHLRDLQDSIKDSSSSQISKQADRNESTRASEPGSSERLSEKSLQNEADVFTGKAQIRQSVESLLNRLESLQLLARQTPAPSGDQQIVALPMKIGGEWTEVNIRFIKKKEGRDKKTKQNHFSVYLNVSPSQLGAISVKLEYELKKSMSLDIEFEKKETRTWFSRNSESLREALSKLDLPQVRMVIHQVRNKEQRREQVKETDGAIDLKI